MFYIMLQKSIWIEIYLYLKVSHLLVRKSSTNRLDHDWYYKASSRRKRYLKRFNTEMKKVRHSKNLMLFFDWFSISVSSFRSLSTQLWNYSISKVNSYARVLMVGLWKKTRYIGFDSLEKVTVNQKTTGNIANIQENVYM